jgi:hypothetical protein
MNAPRPAPRRPFADLQNKSAEQLVTENKGLDALTESVEPDTDDAEDDADGETPAEATSADSDAPVAAPAGDTRGVVMLHHGEHGDVQLVPGVGYDLPTAYADALVSAGRAVATS